VIGTALMDVQARWAYSEIVDSNFSTLYDNLPPLLLNKAQLDALRAKRRSGVPFEDVAPQDRYCLAFMCCCVRPNLMIFMAGIDHFHEGQLNKAAMGALLVPPMVSNVVKFMPFSEYIEIPCSESRDARNVTGEYQASSDPLTVGRLYDTAILLDGYHRAASFWKFAPADASISAYVPTSLSAAPKMV
jgi:hypothetical protein